MLQSVLIIRLDILVRSVSTLKIPTKIGVGLLCAG